MNQPQPGPPLPITVLYDQMRDASVELGAAYVARARAAATEEEAARSWRQVDESQAQTESIDPDDRASIVEWRDRCRQESANLRAS